MKSFFEFCQMLKKEQTMAPAPAAPAVPAKPVIDPTKVIPADFVKKLQATAKGSGNPNVEKKVKDFISGMEKEGFQSIEPVKAQ